MRRLASKTAAFVVGVMACAFCAVTHAEPPSIADFLVRSPAVDFGMSPNGQSLAMLFDDDEHRRIIVLDAHTRQPQHVIPLPDSVKPTWVEWANDERLLVAVLVGEVDRGEYGTYWRAARVLAMDDDGANAVALFENQRSVLRSSYNLAVVTDMLPNDSQHVLMPGVRGGALDLWRVNVYSGAAERVATGSSSTFAWRTDASGAPAFRYDINRRGTVIQIHAPDASGAWRRIAAVREDDLPEFQPVAIGPEPGQSYVLARPDGADRVGVYLYDVHRAEFIETIATHPRVDIAGVFVNPRTSQYLGHFTFDDVYEVHFTDPAMQAHVNALRRHFGADASYSIIDMSDDHRMWILAAAGPSDPGAIYVYDREQTQIEPLAALHPRLVRQELGRSSVVRYQTRDGAQITGYLTLPPGSDDGPHALVLLPHGGPESRDYFMYDRNAQFLATRGYAVFRPNFRGSSGYGRAFAEAGYGEWGGRMQDDLTDAVAHLVATGIADPERVCIMGASYGGYAALAGAAFTPDTYRCAISVAGVSDLSDQAQYVMRVGHEEEQDYIRRSIGDPYDQYSRERLRTRSPEHRVARVRVPVLLLHGDLDGIVPVAQSRDMHHALRRVNADVRYVEVEGEGHSYWSDENETLLYTEVEAFLSRYLPARGAESPVSGQE